MTFTNTLRIEDVPIKKRGAFVKWQRYHQKTLAEIFWPKVERGDPDACWPFKGGRHKCGYGLFYVPGQRFKQSVAHRVAWILDRGEIPNGLWVLHKCDNPPCCNPRHLFLGTHQDNMADCKKKGRNFVPKGELSPSAKLTEKDVINIRKRYFNGGISHRELAEQYGISKSAMGHAINGTKWKHLPGPIKCKAFCKSMSHR